MSLRLRVLRLEDVSIVDVPLHVILRPSLKAVLVIAQIVLLRHRLSCISFLGQQVNLILLDFVAS